MSPSLVLALALAFAQAATSSAQAGRLTGRVTAEGTNAPIAGARVMLFPAAPPQGGRFGPPPQALTDDDGRFAFGGLAEGEYRLDVQKTGFAPLTSGFDTRRTVRVPGEAVQVQLQRGGVIAGRVLDASGEPAPDMHIMALRRVEINGQTRLLPAPMQGMLSTNDLGEFRLAGLPAGEYAIAAMRTMGSPFGGPAVTPTAHTTATTTTFYPGTTNQAAAQMIPVRAGDTTGNIEFQMQSTPVFRIAGTVMDESDQPVAGAMVMLTGDFRNGAVFMGPTSGGQTGDDGRFSIADVAPGSYRLNATIPMRLDRGTTTTWSSSSSSGSATVAGGLSGGVVAGLSGDGGFVSFSDTSIATNSAVEVVVTDANVSGVRLVVRRQRNQ